MLVIFKVSVLHEKFQFWGEGYSKLVIIEVSKASKRSSSSEGLVF